MRALAVLLLLALPLGANAQAHFHHVHLNATDPAFWSKGWGVISGFIDELEKVG